MELREHQKKAVKSLGNGRILHGAVGSGKTITAMAYYLEREAPKDLYVITTARKRDELDWMKEAAAFGVGASRDTTAHGVLTVDSWNNIAKYVDVKDAFFIFDEQRLVGTGAWVKAFIKIAKLNNWIMLSGTPGDTWSDYAPVFIANGFFKNITDFRRRHVLYEPFSKFPKIRGYLEVTKLELLRNEILVEMPYPKHTKRYVNWMDVEYDKELYSRVYKDRWHVYEDRPIKDISELFRVMRRVVNSDPSRLEMVKTLSKTYPKLIVFYNFDYELEMLRTLKKDYTVYEYNGHQKDPVPTDEAWIYLVQYVAGAEAWNCVSTNSMLFYSLTYSYKNFEQAQGRIDRLNTPFSELFYFVNLSNSVVDRGVRRALDEKHDFNEKIFFEKAFDLEPNSEELYAVFE